MSPAPRSNEFEVSIFGPGYGECIVMHIGQNDWLIVDSCIDPESKQPAALSYLWQLGVNPAEAVKQVIATHWHDDHVRGLGQLFGECRSAEFVCSGALRPKEFLTLVHAYGSRSMMDSSGVKEFYEVIRALDKRPKEQGNVARRWALVDRCLWRDDIIDDGQTITRMVHSLSPSDAAVLLAHQHISRLIPPLKTPKRRLAPQTPNHAAVVLWMSVGSMFVLLGSDLEETGNQQSGWSVVVASKTRPQDMATLFKIPHHGSATADLDHVWSEMLSPNPLAVLTPFARGKTPLPTPADVQRICTRTPNAYSTALPTVKRRRKRASVVEKQIQETVRSIRQVDTSTGHVRLRTAISNANPEWHIELFGDASPLQRLYPA